MYRISLTREKERQLLQTLNWLTDTQLVNLITAVMGDTAEHLNMLSTLDSEQERGCLQKIRDASNETRPDTYTITPAGLAYLDKTEAITNG